MRHKTKVMIPAAASATEFSTAMTGDKWDLVSNITSDLLAHSIVLTNISATDHSLKTFVIVYRDEDNRKITETLNMPVGSGTTAITNPGWKVESITPSETIGVDTMSLGTAAGIVYSLPIPLNYRSTNIGITCIVSGTIDYTLKNSNSDIQNKDAAIDWLDHDDAVFVASTVSGNTNFSFCPLAMRVQFNSSTPPASLTLNLAPSDSGR